MDVELRQGVLDVRAGRLGADEQRSRHDVVVRPPGEQREHLGLPPGEGRHQLQSVLPLSPSPGEALQQLPEHPGRDERLALVDGADGSDQLRQRAVPQQEPACPRLDGPGQAGVIGLPGEDDHPALGDPALDQCRGTDPVAVHQVRAEQGEVRPDALRLGHRVVALARSGSHPQVRLAVQDRLHRLAEQ